MKFSKQERMEAKRNGAVAFTFSGYSVFPDIWKAINYAGGVYAVPGDYGVFNVVSDSGAVGGIGGGIVKVEVGELWRLVDNRSRRIKTNILNAAISGNLYRVI